jgi:8-oxo-dGTP pyrophosphatase MutT (NUDIX family)
MAKKKWKDVYYQAAGGVVLDEAGRVLLLKRPVERDNVLTHEVRLPKGHIEKGETPEEAALREVCEESGYCHLQIIADLGDSHVSFSYKNKHVHRDERYFLMRLTQSEQQAQQFPDEHSEEALFVPFWADSPEQAEALLTFESEKLFIRRARAWLARKKKDD